MNNAHSPVHFRPPHALSGLPPETPILVAYSGGADSGALLELLCRYGKEYGTPIYAAHVHHGIRGEEADRDEAFCRERAAYYGIELLVCHADVPALARESGKSVETVAREVRYAFFSEQMKKRGIPLLCTAHHADDNLETVLFNIVRGSGIDGACGIPETRDIDGGTLLRPLLAVSREELLTFCEKAQIPYVTDSTNRDTEYTRNRIRSEVVPVLRTLCPGAEHAAARLSYLLRQDALCLCSMADRFLEENRQGFSVETEKLCGAPYAVVSRALMQLYGEISEGHTLAFCHVEALLALAHRAVPHSSLSLPHGIGAVIENGRLCLNKQQAKKAPTQLLHLPISMGENEISQLSCKIVMEKSENCKNIYKKAIKFHMDFDTILGEPFVRTRQSGDRIRVRGMTRSIKKCWSELGLPQELRERLPILCDERGILAVPYIGVRDDSYAKATDPNAHTVTVCVYVNE